MAFACALALDLGCEFRSRRRARNRYSRRGFFGSDRPPPDLSIAIGASRGIDLMGFRSRPLTPTAVIGADLIIVMDSEQARQLVIAGVDNADFMARPITRRIALNVCLSSHERSQ